MHCTWRESGKKEALKGQEYFFTNIKVWGENFFECSMNKTHRSLQYNHNVSILLGSQKNPCGQTLPVEQSVMCLSQSNKHIRSNLETSQYFGLYDVNQLVELIFTINGLVLNRLNGGLVSVLYKADNIKKYIELEVLKNIKH